MNQKYIVCGVLVIMVILGWNAFLIQRDKELFKVYDGKPMVEKQELHKMNKSR